MSEIFGPGVFALGTNNSACRCRVIHYETCIEIELCPLHAAAPALLATLEALLADSIGPLTERRNGPIVAAQAAIAAAKGGKS